MEDWKADATEKYDFRTVYYWMVPAKVAGRWAGTAEGAKVELDLQQSFQALSGVGAIDGKPARITSGKVTGETVSVELAAADGRRLAIGAALKGAALQGSGVTLAKG
jgi:hypothetical protein